MDNGCGVEPGGVGNDRKGDMTDILEHLQNSRMIVGRAGEAADEITRLREQNERLKEALAECACCNAAAAMAEAP